jgi:peptidoglycan/LPS O-acetylase OafA/YrhL
MKSGRIPELDGIRALALIPVLYIHSNVIEHTGLGIFAAYGWITVDLFFVLSGFLITGILLDAKGKEGYFRNFYARRVLRVWPLYYALLFLVLVLFPRFRHEAQELGRFSPWYYFFFLQNLFPFGGFVLVLTPTWTLGVEEQFYLVWPLLISLVSRRFFPVLIAAGLVVLPLLRLGTLYLTHDWIYIYILTFCRADALLVGAALAYWMRSSSYSEGRLLAFGRWAVLLSAVPMLWIFSRSIAARGRESIMIYSYVAVAVGGLLALALSPGATLWRRFLRLSVMQYFGKISYGLYLVHRLVYELFERSPLYSLTRFPGRPRLTIATTFVAEMSLAVVAASLSWYFFESRVLKLKRCFEPHASAPISAEAVA